MTESALLKLFPNMSKSTLEANLSTPPAKTPSTGIVAQKKPVCDGPPDWAFQATEDSIKNFRKFTITISGQVMGGKNNMVVTRSGLHFPKKSWAKWRDEKVAEVRAQLPESWDPISIPTDIELEYIAGDRRRRDQPAVIDAIFHVLEKAGVVKDDTLLWISQSSRAYDKANPCAIIRIRTSIGNKT